MTGPGLHGGLQRIRSTADRPGFRAFHPRAASVAKTGDGRADRPREGEGANGFGPTTATGGVKNSRAPVLRPLPPARWASGCLNIFLSYR